VNAAAIKSKYPAQWSGLMANMSTIVKVSQKFVWPSWVVYDQNFRQEVANMLGMTWAKVNPSIYPQYFISMAANTEGWCKQCQSIKHPSDRCAPLDPVPNQGQSRGASVCKRTWPVLPPPHRQRGQPRWGRQISASSSTDSMGNGSLESPVAFPMCAASAGACHVRE